MIRIAHLSDLHFGAHLPELIEPAAGGHRADGAPGHCDQWRPHAACGAVGIRAGRGLPGGAAGAPAVAVPGNHDIPQRAVLERMTDPRRRWRRFIDASTEPTVLCAGGALIGLDTVRRAQPHLDWSAGGVSSARLERLEERLARVRGAQRGGGGTSSAAPPRLGGGAGDAPGVWGGPGHPGGRGCRSRPLGPSAPGGAHRRGTADHHDRQHAVLPHEGPAEQLDARRDRGAHGQHIGARRQRLARGKRPTSPRS